MFHAEGPTRTKGVNDKFEECEEKKDQCVK